MRRALGFSPFLLGVTLASLSTARQEPTPAAATPKREAPERLEIPGVENAFRLSPRLYSGGDPHGAGALKALKDLGIRTVISVDGVTPDVETAKRLGIRYVHLPIGYDGVPRGQAVRMVKAMKTLPGPVYVHCHHGVHRGPAAAAVCAMASEGWSRERAADWMKLAGTAADYRGLFASIRDFAPPTGEELAQAGEPPERSQVPALVEMMVKIDEQWDVLKAVQRAGFKSPPGRPDVDPAIEALQFLELFRETSRLPESRDRGGEFLKEASSAERLANGLYSSIARHRKQASPDSLREIQTSFAAAGKSCKSCHMRFRDN